MNFVATLKVALASAQLPTDLTMLIGRTYQFDFESFLPGGGFHHTILAGTILALEVTDEGSPKLYVTSPRIRGDMLLYLEFTEGRWSALGQSTMPQCAGRPELYLGELTLL